MFYCIVILFEKCKNRLVKSYGLRFSHYFSAPALIWDTLLSVIKVELDLISDIDTYLIFEKGTRGGFSYISRIYSKGNNKNWTSYDHKKPRRYITYLDKNDLYGYVKSLPMGRFKWMAPEHHWKNYLYCTMIIL